MTGWIGPRSGGRPFLRWLTPSVPALVFAVVLILCLGGGRSAMLNDPGTYWHVRLGREILRTGLVPRTDTLTFTHARAPWVDQSWAFDLGLAAIVDRWGWSAAIAATAVGLAWIYGYLARGLLRDGTTPLVAFVVAVLAAGIGSIHFLVRPHLFTFAGVVWTLDACRTYHEGKDRRIWILPLVVALWANLHGGFLAGPLIVATAMAGHAISGRWDVARRRRLLGFMLVFVLSCVAPLANPYGLDLYRHVVNLLYSSGVTELIDEYKSAPFGKPETSILEQVILALVALPIVSRRRSTRYEMAHVLVWLHFALGSFRQAPLFALAASAGLARILDGLISPPEREARDRDRWSAWPVLASLAMAFLVTAGVRLGGPDPTRWPLAAVPVLDRQPLAMRIFHEQDWGGMIESECRPTRLAFLDDRFELYGKAAILEYVAALQGGPTWEIVRDQRRIDLVWVRPERGLALRLAADPVWEALHRDRVSVLFRRRRTGGPSVKYGPEVAGGPRSGGPSARGARRGG